MHAAEAEAWLILSSSGLSPERQRMLVETFGSAQALLAASDQEIREVPGVLPAQVAKLRAASARADLGRLRDLCLETGVSLISFQDEAYPRRLAEIPDGPPLLYVQGEFTRNDELAVALVGTRKATPYGLQIARRLAAELTRRGFTIVSGMALGIDAEAHEGALEAGGRSIAVMATGADITYPPSHRDLRARLAASGAVVTEASFGSGPTRYAFPQRNRIIAGLSLGVVVVEAPDRSGALITAEHAADQGREVFAVPGSIDSPLSRGCHHLIKDGAHLVEVAEDVVEGLGLLLTAVPSRPERRRPELSGSEPQVYDALGPQPLRVDQLVAATGLDAATLGATLMMLEVKGLARRFAGGTYLRIQ
ncbi:MAG TPA: DNA-processing protein DprA [Armatimonadota bacterium]|jgi:DNA processing protein